MSRYRLAVPLAAALAIASVLASSMPAHAAEPARNKARSAIKKQQEPAKRAIERKDNDYSIRANSVDPSGDFKGYPDWARAALGPKRDD